MRLSLLILLLGAQSALASNDGEARWFALELQQEFNCRFNINRSEHFVLVAGGDTDAQSRLRLLETTFQEFYVNFEAAGFRLEKPAQSLICLVFANEDQFTQYALATDQVNMSWSRGYYSTRTNRVALYPKATEPPLRTEDKAYVAPVAGLVAEGQPYANAGLTWASSTHEAAHQLAFNSGLLKPGVMYPLWAAEGMATCFEYNGTEREFGPREDNGLRRRDLQRAMAERRLMPMSELLCLTQVAPQQLGELDAVYSQCWSLFRFLLETRPAELQAYLGHLWLLEPGPRSPRVLVGEFTKAFGSPERVEGEWLRWVKAGR